MNSALIADIQKTSVDDGPGIRTTVFFKGCPLKCSWCHNPECISFEREVLFYPEKCIHCMQCEKGCFSGARVVCGKEYTADELLCEILSDKDYYGTDGGVTFSGGEPFAQSEFLNEITDLCIENKINCAVETSLIYYNENILKKMQVVMADLKIWDSGIHKTYTGAGNGKIKEHFKMLDTLGVPIIMRTPVIPEIEQGIFDIHNFAKELKNVVKYELLPYHPLGNTKRAALGLKEDGFTVPANQYMEELKKYAFVR